MNSYRVAFTSRAEKELHRLPKKAIARIIPRLERLALMSRPKGCKKLKGGDNEWRIRVAITGSFTSSTMRPKLLM